MCVCSVYTHTYIDRFNLNTYLNMCREFYLPQAVLLQLDFFFPQKSLYFFFFNLQSLLKFLHDAQSNVNFLRPNPM